MNVQQWDQLPHGPDVGRKIKRINLFLTVKILLHTLSKEESRLRMIAQKVLKDSYKFHHTYPEETSVAELIETGLKEAVGDELWNKAAMIQWKSSLSVKFSGMKKK